MCNVCRVKGAKTSVNVLLFLHERLTKRNTYTHKRLDVKIFYDGILDKEQKCGLIKNNIQ